MSKVVTIDNTSPDDNWLVNRSGIAVTVACNEMFGSFAVNLSPGESKRITYDVKANAYPAGRYSYDNLKYGLGKGEKWEVRREGGELIMVKVGSVAKKEPQRSVAKEVTQQKKRWWQFWKESLVYCPECNLPFKTKDDLSTHVRNWHTKKD